MLRSVLRTGLKHRSLREKFLASLPATQSTHCTSSVTQAPEPCPVCLGHVLSPRHVPSAFST